MKIKIGLMIVLIIIFFPVFVLGGQITFMVFESSKDGISIPVPEAKIEVFGGKNFKTLYFSGYSDKEGLFIIPDIPLGKSFLIKLLKPGYVTQYDIRSFSEFDIERGAFFWTSNEYHLESFYQSLGEVFDRSKGHIYLEINNELEGEGIEGVNLTSSSGNVYELGQGDYLIANAVGSKVKITIEKRGYNFDIEASEIPIFEGGLTQYYLNVQSGGTLSISGDSQKVTSAPIFGFIKTLSKGDPLKGVSVAFLSTKKVTVRPSVVTDENGYYRQDGFPIKKWVKVIPSKSPWRFKPKSKTIYVKPGGKQVDFLAK